MLHVVLCICLCQTVCVCVCVWVGGWVGAHMPMRASSVLVSMSPVVMDPPLPTLVPHTCQTCANDFVLVSFYTRSSSNVLANTLDRR